MTVTRRNVAGSEVASARPLLFWRSKRAFSSFSSSSARPFLAFQTGHFDCIVTTWTLCSVPDPNQALAEMRRVLRSGGRYPPDSPWQAENPVNATVNSAAREARESARYGFMIRPRLDDPEPSVRRIKSRAGLVRRDAFLCAYSGARPEPRACGKASAR